MANSPILVEKTISTTNDATDWVQLDKGESCSISLASTSFVGVLNIQRSFDGSTVLGNLSDNESGVSDFSAGAQLNYVAAAAEYIRAIGTTVTSGSMAAKIKRG